MRRDEFQREARRRWGKDVDAVDNRFGPERYALMRVGDDRPLARGTSWQTTLRIAHWNLVKRFVLVGLPVKRWERTVPREEAPIACKDCEPYVHGERKGRGHRRCGTHGCECYCNR
jgi:hypothetical protein